MRARISTHSTRQRRSEGAARCGVHAFKVASHKVMGARIT